MLYDLTAIDERMRIHPEGPPASDFTLVYHLLSFDRNEYVRIKVPLQAGPGADRYEYRSLASRELVRTGSLGHVRDPLSRDIRIWNAS